MIDLIKRDKPESILWVTPSAELADVDIPREFETWKAKRYIKRLTTSTYASLNKIVGHFDMVILDEEQHLTENNAVNLLNRSIDYVHICSMTGTATKHDDKIELYKRLNLKVLVDISINEAVDIGLLSNYSIKILEVDMSRENNIDAGNKNKRFKTSEFNRYNWLTSNVSKSMYQNESAKKFAIIRRLQAIKNSDSKFKATQKLLSTLKGRILIFSSTIKQAEQLCKYTYHSKTNNKYLNLFKTGDIDRLALVNAGGTGHTYKEVDHLIMVQADSDKNGLTSQKIC